MKALDREKIMPRVLRRMRQTGSLTAACKKPGMPHIATVLGWAERDESIASAIARARASAAHTLAERAATLARRAEAECIKGDRSDSSRVSARRLAIESLTWMAERWNRAVYGQAPTLALNAGSLTLHVGSVIPQAAPTPVMVEATNARLDSCDRHTTKLLTTGAPVEQTDA